MREGVDIRVREWVRRIKGARKRERDKEERGMREGVMEERGRGKRGREGRKKREKKEGEE